MESLHPKKRKPVDENNFIRHVPPKRHNSKGKSSFNHHQQAEQIIEKKQMENVHEHEENEEDSDEDDDDDLIHPMIFQCSKCMLIVGDSTCFVSSNQDLRTLTLQYVSRSIKTSDETYTSDKGGDLGSTYHRLMCSCGESIGKVYLTTARHLDDIRDFMTLDSSKIATYQIGDLAKNIDHSSAETRKRMTKFQELMTEDSKKFEHIENSIEDLSKKLTKTQNLMILFNDRIGQLENNEGDPDEDQS